MPTQICSKCGLEKDIEEFRLRSQFTKRRQSYCIDCGLEMGRDWYQRNKDYQKANARKHRDEYRTNGATTQRIKLEIAICDVMCANCHRRVTAEERGWFRGRK